MTIGAAALVLMAVAATVEATAAVISRHRLRRAAEAQGRQRSVQGFFDPRRTLSASLLVVQAVALVVAASFLTTAIGRELGTVEHLLAALLVVAAYLLFGRALPLALVARRPDQTASVLVRIADLLGLLAWPLTSLADAIGRLIARLIPGPPAAPAPAGTEDEFRSLALNGDDGLIEAEEREMIDGVLHLEEMTARDIMVPRVDMVAVERSASPAEIVETITGAGHSRIPVYQESIDQILGILYAKDLLPYVVGPSEQLPPLSQLVRPAYVVPESKRADHLLKEMRRDRVHIAIVADEYGGTAGMVTFEDILEEIVGEIQDEYDVEQPLFERIGEAELLADGRLPIEDVEDALGVAFTDDDYGTVGGFVHRHLGRVPREGDRFDAEGVHVEIVTVEGNRVRRLRLTRTAPVAAAPTDLPPGQGGAAPAGDEGSANGA